MKHYKTKSINCDILVAGGGPAGVPCAIAAARQGAKVILCHDRPALGGNAGSEVRMHIVGANAYRPGMDLELEARETGIIEEIRLENAVRNAQRSPSMFDFILYDKCKAEPNLTLLLNTRVVDTEVEDGIIKSALAIRDSTEDRFEISATVFVDCTGDGGLGVAAGAPFFKGREDKAQYGESLARDVADSKTLGSTLLFMARKHPHPMPFTAPSWARKFSAQDFLLRDHTHPDDEFGLEYGYWWIEWGGQLDTIKDNEEIRDELLAIVMGVWDHVKNAGDHGAENWALDWFGVLPGKRESRRFVGQYVLSEKDVMESIPQEDAIAYGGWPVDIHPPEGVDRPLEPPCVQTPVPRLYDIPLRCCVSRDVKNLLFAGRNLSATHVAFASTRVMATCAVVGEGVGMAAAVAVESGFHPGELASNSELVAEIRRRIADQDGYLIGENSCGENNLLNTAVLTASSAQSGGAAANVISCQNRCVRGERGVAEDRQVDGFHRWMSDPAAGLSAWLEARWSEPVDLTRLQIIFDTGLHRYLTFTLSDQFHTKMLWGAGQPETVKDFNVIVETRQGWQTVAEIRGNWQRRWSWVLSESQKIMAIRVEVLSTWGLDHARIIQINATSITRGSSLQPQTVQSQDHPQS